MDAEAIVAWIETIQTFCLNQNSSVDHDDQDQRYQKDVFVPLYTNTASTL